MYTLLRYYCTDIIAPLKEHTYTDGNVIHICWLPTTSYTMASGFSYCGCWRATWAWALLSRLEYLLRVIWSNFRSICLAWHRLYNLYKISIKPIARIVQITTRIVFVVSCICCVRARFVPAPAVCAITTSSLEVEPPIFKLIKVQTLTRPIRIMIYNGIFHVKDHYSVVVCLHLTQ